MTTAQAAARSALDDNTGTVQKLLVGIPEACDLTGLGRSKLYELLAAGTIVSVRVGKRRLIPMASLEAFVGSLIAGAVID